MNKEAYIYTAPVLVPGAKDCDYLNGEIPLTIEQVEKFAESYKTYGFVDDEHTLTVNGKKIGRPLNSYITNKEVTLKTSKGFKTYPKGTWLLETLLFDDDAIYKAKNGLYTGYSPSILNRKNADKLKESLKTNINSSGNSLIKDIPDGVVLSVSLTECPCLSESVKCDDPNIEDVKLMSENDSVNYAQKLFELFNNILNKKEEVKDPLKFLTDEVAALREDNKLLKEEFNNFKNNLNETNDTVESDTVLTETVQSEAVTAKSKVEPVHDNLEVDKSESYNIYEALGRNVDGTKRL